MLGEIIRRLGYVPHGALPAGRTNNSVMPDAAKTTLYILPGSEAERSTARVLAADIARAYTLAQCVPSFGIAGGADLIAGTAPGVLQ